MLRMRKCLYGHPLSGHIWIEVCLQYLKEQGWKSCPGNRAVLRKGKTMICVYVDDVCAAGPPEELEDFRKVWDPDAPRHCRECNGALPADDSITVEKLQPQVRRCWPEGRLRDLWRPNDAQERTSALCGLRDRWEKTM